jgi:hypothetical protein
MTFRDWLDTFPDDDASALAKRALVEIPELLVDIVILAVEHHRRESARAVERQAFATLLRQMRASRATDAPPTDSPSPDALDAFRLLVGQRFKLGDGSEISWGQATIPQHEQRVAVLESMMRGLQDTIARHRAVIEFLRARGASCLDEVVP